MTLPTLCIERPVMTTLLTMAVVAVGGVGYFFPGDDGSFDLNAA